MSSSAKKRRLTNPVKSIFDWTELDTHLVKAQLLTKRQAVQLVQRCFGFLPHTESYWRKRQLKNENETEETETETETEMETETKTAMRDTRIWLSGVSPAINDQGCPLKKTSCGDLEMDWNSIFPELPKRACRKLNELKFRLFTMSMKGILESNRDGGDTAKLILEVPDGHRLESCIMRFGLPKRETETERKKTTKLRATVCVSSQSGCRMGCNFCATGTMGLRGSLTNGEIVEQVVLANLLERVFRGLWASTICDSETLSTLGISKFVSDRRCLRNVVYMGMGEPMDNYKEVIRSVTTLNEQLGYSQGKITISTVGANLESIRQLKTDAPRVCLALSLHGPTQEARDRIVPTSKGVLLQTLLETCFDFVENQRTTFSNNLAKTRKLLIEYCVIRDVNDSDRDAYQLVELFKTKLDRVIFNAIPYNPTDVKDQFQPPTQTQLDRFSEILKDNSVTCFVRQEHGQDIFGACGQLALKTDEMSALEGRPSIKSLDPSLVPTAPTMNDVMFTPQNPEDVQLRNKYNLRRTVNEVYKSIKIQNSSTASTSRFSFSSGTLLAIGAAVALTAVIFTGVVFRRSTSQKQRF